MNTETMPEMTVTHFGIADWQRRGVALTSKQMTNVGEFPWDDAVLHSPCPFNPGKMVHETHSAFVGLDHVTIALLQDLYPESGQPRFSSYKNGWCANEMFTTKATLAVRWYLVLNDIVPHSLDRLFKEQYAMLPEEYEVPSAVVEAAKNLFAFEKSGTYVNPNCFARTADFALDRARDNARVIVGKCTDRGMVIDYCDGGKMKNHGIAASLRLP